MGAKVTLFKWEDSEAAFNTTKRILDSMGAKVTVF
jgi:hypothetical protein